MYLRVIPVRLHDISKLLLMMCCMCCTVIVRAQSVKIDTSRIMGHPRLLLLPGQEEGIKKNIASNIAWGKVHADILEACDSLLDKPALERMLIGRRLLDKSREALRRIFFLSYAWRMSGKKKYFRRCEEELLAISAFTDWNPSHFLDVAEMTMAAGIGYDWLYKDLSPASRQRISEAVITKGLTPSLEEKYNGWLRGKNNWNQVCNAGISFGAAAVYESRPALAAQLIERAIQSVQIPMKEYAPDGNYTEGYSYWAYGTSYNVFLISLLEQLFGTDYGLSQLPGFLKTPFFYEHVVGLSGKPFNYSDCGDGTEGLQPAMFWFANKLKDPSVLWQEKDNLEKGRSMAKWNRFLPAAMIWGKDVDVTAVTSPAAAWVGDGENPVALLRTSWNKQSGIFIGFKGGTPAAGHGHMDAGSFVLDAEGVRWSADLGMQGYESLESKGLQIWDMGQASDRWKVFRYTNFSHSTITVNKALQQVNGRATFLKHSGDSLFTRAVMDLGSLYAGSLTKAVRGIAIVNKQYVTVRDEWEAGDSTCTVRWAMLTPARVVSIDKNQVQLQNNGKKLTLYVNGLPEGAALRTWPTDPPNSYDALNIGTVLVGFEMTLPAHTKKEVTVLLVPGEGQVMIKKSSLLPLSEW